MRISTHLLTAMEELVYAVTELMKAGFPPIDIKFTDRIAYYNAFDEYHVSRIYLLWKSYLQDINERLDMFLEILK